MRTVRELISGFRGLTRTGTQKRILAELDLARATLDALLDDDGAPDPEKLERLLCAMQQTSTAPKAEALGLIGKAHFLERLQLSEVAKSSFEYRKLVGSDLSAPTVAEIAFAFDPDKFREQRSIFCGINNSPALMDAGALRDLSYSGLDGLLQAQHVDKESPVVFVLHLAGSTLAFTDRGKSSLSLLGVPDLGDALETGCEAVTEKWRKQRERELRDERAQEHRWDVSSKPPQDASHRALFAKHLSQAVDEVSGAGAARFSQRMLFYVMRRMLQRDSKKELQWGTFLGIVTDHEGAHGDILGMYRDNRGSIYIPHTRERIAIGTLSVEKFKRPAFTFNKILALEKEGLFEALIEAKWPERNDCALLTSKGFFTRAGRDVIDQLPIEGEHLTVYCVHDADAAGTLIYETLGGETKARGARLVTVVNLGLDPWEGIAMGLEHERVDPIIIKKTGKHKWRPCGAYVDQSQHPPPHGFTSWSAWLQKWRIRARRDDRATAGRMVRSQAPGRPGQGDPARRLYALPAPGGYRAPSDGGYREGDPAKGGSEDQEAG